MIGTCYAIEIQSMPLARVPSVTLRFPSKSCVLSFVIPFCGGQCSDLWEGRRQTRALEDLEFGGHFRCPLTPLAVCEACRPLLRIFLDT